MVLKVDRRVVRAGNVGGRGGKEAFFLKAFPGLQKANEKLWDAIDPETQTLVEFKKQADLQWFDIGKYHGLAAPELEIRMVFILHRKGSIDRIAVISLRHFLDILTNDTDHQQDGWTLATIEASSRLKELHPRLQLKVPLKVRRFFEVHGDRPEVEILYP